MKGKESSITFLKRLPNPFPIYRLDGVGMKRKKNGEVSINLSQRLLNDFYIVKWRLRKDKRF